MVHFLVPEVQGAWQWQYEASWEWEDTVVGDQEEEEDDNDDLVAATVALRAALMRASVDTSPFSVTTAAEYKSILHLEAAKAH